MFAAALIANADRSPSTTGTAGDWVIQSHNWTDAGAWADGETWND